MATDRRPAFDCLWCGARYEPLDPDDLEAWARLCPDCLGRAGENSFLRFRVREAVAARGRSAREGSPGPRDHAVDGDG